MLETNFNVSDMTQVGNRQELSECFEEDLHVAWAEAAVEQEGRGGPGTGD